MINERADGFGGPVVALLQVAVDHGLKPAKVAEVGIDLRRLQGNDGWRLRDCDQPRCQFRTPRARSAGKCASASSRCIRPSMMAASARPILRSIAASSSSIVPRAAKLPAADRRRSRFGTSHQRRHRIAGAQFRAQAADARHLLNVV